jgi:DNA-binding Lrp family transcriptional regulator
VKQVQNMTSEQDEKIAFTKSDITLIAALLNHVEGTLWSALQEETGLSPRTLSKRLKKLQDLRFVVRTVDHSAYPPRAIYKLDQSASPTKGDLGLVYEALRAFNYIRKLDMLTAEAASKTGRANPIKIYYSRLYPYFLWCLYYGSKAETIYTEEQIEKFFLDALKGKLKGTIHADKQDGGPVRNLINLSWSDLKEKELKSEIVEGKSFFVSRFPADLQDLAENFFYFYLDKRIDSWKSILEDFKLIVDDKYVRLDFESHFGKKVPEYKLVRFLNVLMDVSRTKSPQRQGSSH